MCSVVAVGRARSCVTPTPIFPSGAARTHTQCSAQVSKGKWLCLIPVIGGTSLKLPVARVFCVADRALLLAEVAGVESSMAHVRGCTCVMNASLML